MRFAGESISYSFLQVWFLVNGGGLVKYPNYNFSRGFPLDWRHLRPFKHLNPIARTKFSMKIFRGLFIGKRDLRRVSFGILTIVPRSKRKIPDISLMKRTSSLHWRTPGSTTRTPKHSSAKSSKMFLEETLLHKPQLRPNPSAREFINHSDHSFRKDVTRKIK